MITLYAWSTPNGFKPLILLEEAGLPYRLHRVDLRAGEQKRPGYLAINPNGKIPAMVDENLAGDRITLFESGAILVYLAEKSGQFLAHAPDPRFRTLQWLMWQVGAIGPTFGQLGAFSRAEPPNPGAADRFLGESTRLLGVLDGHLSTRPWLADDYSIADIATFTWVRAADFLGLNLAGFKAVRDWRDRIAARPAAQRALGRFEAPG